ncbi:hypothetical protein AJ80_09350 [Polytolypa hystricis UAMH7299]|uniref:Methyltransferase domain-containing protein n=1 Tax=Polytolypa hystricis (strain UAMH7299) TaxID=1447883 RepID=A0A2B7WS37_POLH7|nr:hypothetical protein AJ80_09350 [Polytolypa hystricis UAMH7299]
MPASETSPTGQALEIDKEIAEKNGCNDEMWISLVLMPKPARIFLNCCRSINTSSIETEALEDPKENGRSYHAYREGRYLLPNDDTELQRLDIHHAMMVTALDGELYLAPIGNAPRRVLDLCTGSGIWAMEFADKFPDCEVSGNDLSPTQPKLVPPNLHFFIDDAEADWVYEDKPFDFIHARYLSGAIRDFPRLIRQAFNCTRSGGWVQFADWDSVLYSDDKSTEGTAFESFNRITLTAFAKAGFNMSPGPSLEQWLTETGFINIKAKKFKLPFAPWGKDRKDKRLGINNFHQIDLGIESTAMAILTRYENWSPQDVQIMAAKSRHDARNPDIHGVFDFFRDPGENNFVLKS